MNETNEPIHDGVRRRRRRLQSYIAIFLAFAALTGLSYRALDRAYASFGCYSSAATVDEFLAYCASPQFGDYEHGAYFYDFEPTAVASLLRADVVFFGSSRLQFAFSTPAFARYFAQRSIRPYLLGFGYYEPGAFPLALIRKYHIAPKAIVINADPFFKNTSTGLVRVLSRWRAIPELFEYWQKKYFEAVLPWICTAHPALCRPAIRSLYRTRRDGAWTAHNDLVSQGYPLEAASMIYTREMTATDQDFAEQFIRESGAPRSCIVLTSVPNSAINSEAYVAEMGRSLGVHVSLPRLDGLTTFDGSHLTSTSADRWSEAFLASIDSLLTACVRK